MTAPNVSLVSLGIDVAFDELRAAVDWQQRSVRVFGQVHPQPRLTRWYGAAAYTYSGLTWEPAAMPALLQRIRAQVEQLTGERFNSVLCNLYRGGADSVGWHADDEPIFGGDPVVASCSFGAPRSFQMRRTDKSDRQEWTLRHGDLFVMGRGVQPAWQHAIPKTAKPTGERINLTFRRTV